MQTSCNLVPRGFIALSPSKISMCPSGTHSQLGATKCIECIDENSTLKKGNPFFILKDINSPKCMFACPSNYDVNFANFTCEKGGSGDNNFNLIMDIVIPVGVCAILGAFAIWLFRKYCVRALPTPGRNESNEQLQTTKREVDVNTQEQSASSPQAQQASPPQTPPSYITPNSQNISSPTPGAPTPNGDTPLEPNQVVIQMTPEEIQSLRRENEEFKRKSEEVKKRDEELKKQQENIKIQINELNKAKEELKDKTKCSICIDKQFDIRLECGHLYCSVCVSKFPNCPSCGVVIRQENAGRVFIP